MPPAIALRDLNAATGWALVRLVAWACKRPQRSLRRYTDRRLLEIYLTSCCR